MKPRRLSWVLLGLVVSGLLVFGSLDTGGDVTPQARAASLHNEYACPTCDGQSVAESNATVAQNIREQIDRMVAADRADAEIRDALVASWGDGVLLAPRSSGFVGLIWALPIALVVVGLVGVAFVLRRWSTATGRSASPADRALVERHLDS